MVELDTTFNYNSLKEIAVLFEIGFNSYLDKVDKEIDENEFLANEYMINMNSLIDNSSYILFRSIKKLSKR